MEKKLFLIYIILLKQTLTIYGEKLLLQKLSKKPQKISKKKNLKEIEKLFFYEERTDSYKEELTKLMKRYNFKINLKKNKNFWFSFKNTSYCKSCDKNFERSFYKDDHYIKNHLVFSLKKNQRFFLDLDSEIRRFSLNLKNRKFRYLICFDFFNKISDFQKIQYENQFKFCEKMIDVWDKHKLHVLYIIFYYAFFYFLLLFIIVLFLVATMEYFDPAESESYKYE